MKSTYMEHPNNGNPKWWLIVQRNDGQIATAWGTCASRGRGQLSAFRWEPYALLIGGKQRKGYREASPNRQAIQAREALLGRKFDEGETKKVDDGKLVLVALKRKQP